MQLQIAGYIVDIDCAEALLRLMPNYQPFWIPDKERADVLCRIRTGCRIPADGKRPDLVSRLEGKDLSLWLYPDYCSLSVRYQPDGYVYRMRACRDWKEVQTNWCPDSSDSLWALNDILMIAFVYSSAFRQTVLVHASAVVVAGRGCAFIGPSGIGKSTHSRLWLQHIPGAWLLNDDQPVLRMMPDGSAWIYGSPWSGKTPCYQQEGVRLCALFFMKQALCNRLLPLGGIEVFRRLMASTSSVARDAFSFAGISDTLACLAGAVRGYVLENRPERAAALLSYGAFREKDGDKPA